MSTLAIEIQVPYAEDVTVTHEALNVDLSDGRTISVPVAWFPRLLYSTQKERDNWRLIGRGQGIHWEEIDEDRGHYQFVNSFPRFFGFRFQCSGVS